MAGWIDPEERDREVQDYMAQRIATNAVLGSEPPTEQTEEETFGDVLGQVLYKPTETSPLSGLAESQKRLDEATARRDGALTDMNAIFQEMIRNDEQRAAELKPRFTQQELDDRRAKSTAVTMLTSALANIANGIAVGKGGLNATVPDGYTAAYEHWNDVQKRHDTRNAEYQKLIDSVYQKKYGMKKAEYDLAEAERKEARVDLTQDKNHQYGLQKATITAEANKAIARERNESNERIATIKANTPKATKSSGGGKGKAPAAPSTTFTYGGTTYTTPSGVSTEQALTAIATSAKQWLNSTKDGLNDQAIDNKITAIDTALKHVGDFTDKNAEAILTALAKAGYKGDIQGIMDALKPKQQTTKKNTNGNGGKKTIHGFGRAK